MAEEFEYLKTTELLPEAIRKTVANLQRLPRGIELAPEYGQGMVVGERRWTFVLTREAAEHWEELGFRPLTLAVLAYYLPESERYYAQRILVALPGEKGEVQLEMHDNSGGVLWTGTGAMKDGELYFSMPITRPGADIKGIVEGRVSPKGGVEFTNTRLPRPLKKQYPDLVAED